MKKIALLSLLTLTTITTYSQWTVEPSTPMYQEPDDEVLEGQEVDIEVWEDKDFRTVTVIVVQKVPIGYQEWEGWGYDNKGQWYYLHSYKGKITGIAKPRPPHL